MIELLNCDVQIRSASDGMSLSRCFKGRVYSAHFWLLRTTQHVQTTHSTQTCTQKFTGKKVSPGVWGTVRVPHIGIRTCCFLVKADLYMESHLLWA